MYITWQQANDLHLLSTKIQPYDSILKPRAYTSLEGILGGLIRGDLASEGAQIWGIFFQTGALPMYPYLASAP